MIKQCFELLLFPFHYLLIANEICGDKDPKGWQDFCVNLLCASLPQVDGLCNLVKFYYAACEESGKTVPKNLPDVCK